MNINNYEEVKTKFKKLIDLDNYYDYLLLSDEDFVNKYKHLGWTFTSDYFEVRFDKKIDVINIIQNFNSLDDECLLMPINSDKKTFKVKTKNLKSFLVENDLNQNDFILLNEKPRWILVKNKFNKLIGLDSFIKKRMKKNWFFENYCGMLNFWKKMGIWKVFTKIC